MSIIKYMADIYWFCSDEQFQPEDLVKHAVLAEQAGFDGVMISEHFHPWVDDRGASGFAFTTLGAMAVKTKRIQLMTMVTTPLFRFHPAVVAQAAATIDRLSAGRFALGVGTGENINERPLGFVLPAYKERSERLKEAREIIQRLLSGERLDFSGQYYQTNLAKLYSPPLHPVPIYLAAGGPQSATTAGNYYDGIIISVKDIQDALTNLVTVAYATQPNKNFKTIANRWSIYAKDEGQAWEAIQAQRGLRTPSRADGISPLQLQDEADKLPRNKILSSYNILKSPSDYIATYGPLITDIGADIIGIQTTSIDQPATIAMLGKEVLPKLHQLKKKED